MNTACLVSPPGTGKTTYLVDQILKAGEKHGLNNIFVASFTRTAAKEISTRAMDKLGNISEFDAPNFGTLHAHGYHAVGGSHKVAENCIKQWNADHPEYELSGNKNSDVDEVREDAQGTTVADGLYDEMMMYRALLTPQEFWKTSVRAFASRWETWKQANGIIDYTDMLEIPLRDCEEAPGRPRIGMLDEAQDASPLQMALFRKWGAAMDYIVLSGDPDQTIFEWAGARPEVMVGGEYTGKRILAQSYRVPRAVHELAMQTIRRVRVREDVEYHPRDAEGEVRKLTNVNLRTPRAIVEDMRRYTEEGKSVMLLASCSYMLEPLIREMRERGIPFHNPYRTKAGAWNPLRLDGDSATGAVTTVSRLLSFVEQVPNGDGSAFDAKTMLLWYEVLKSTGNVPRGKRDELVKRLIVLSENKGKTIKVPASFYDPNAAEDAMIDVLSPDECTVSPLDMQEYFEASCAIWEFFARPDIQKEAVNWYADNVIAAKKKALEYPARVLEFCGAGALKEKPRVIIGTIHSVKGGEADAVYVAPDLSNAGFVSANMSADAKDAITRLKYVAYTRARESLVLLDPFSSYVL